MRTVFNMAVVAFSVLIQTSFASGASFTVRVGGTEISIPAPEGFHDISKLSPETKDLAETFTPPSNRLLGVFVPESDLELVLKNEMPELKTYMFLQSFRQLEDYTLYRREFNEMADGIKKQQSSLLQSVEGELDSLLAGASEKLSDEHRISLPLQATNSVPLGVFLEERNAIGFASLSKSEVAVENEEENITMIMAVVFLRLKGRLLYAYVYERYETRESIDWVRKTSIQWAESMLEANGIFGGS